MSYKIIRDANNRHQTGREIVAILDTDEDLAALGNAYAPGSQAIVTQQGGNTYMMNASGEWVKFDDGGSANGGGSGLPSGSSPNQYLVTDGDGNAKWEDKLCWSEGVELSWDGDISNPNYDADKQMCKVSDVPMTKEELVGAKITGCSFYYDEHNNRIPIYTIGTIEDGDVSENDGLISVEKTLTEESGDTVKTRVYSVLTETMGVAPGVYFGHTSDFASVTVELSTETIHPIDKKYLRGNTIFFVQSSTQGQGDTFLYRTEDGANNYDEAQRVTKSELEAAFFAGAISVKDISLEWYFMPSFVRFDRQWGEMTVNESFVCLTAEYVEEEG